MMGNSKYPFVSCDSCVLTVILILNLSIGSAVASSATDTSLSWNVEDLANSREEQVILQGSRDKTLKSIDRSQMLYLYAVTQSIERAAEEEVQLLIMPGDSPNAAAGMIKGRKTVLVNFAMLDMVGKDMHQWAALIGHEIAHIKLHHQDKRVGRQIPLIIVQSIILSRSSSIFTELSTDLAMKGVTTAFSREAERDADYLGAIWAVEAGYDPAGAVTLHENLLKLHGTNPIPFLSTHPSGSERIRTLQGLSERLSEKE